MSHEQTRPARRITDQTIGHQPLQWDEMHANNEALQGEIDLLNARLGYAQNENARLRVLLNGQARLNVLLTSENQELKLKLLAKSI